MRHKILAQIISNVIENKTPSNEIGLLSGSFGDIFLLYHYSEIDISYKKIADNLLDDYLTRLSTVTYMPYTYCGGIAGVGIGMYILHENGYISLDNDFFEDIDILLYNMLLSDINKNYYDFLHGAIGLGFYFIKRTSKINSDTCKQALELLYNYLLTSAIIDQSSQTAKWITEQSKRSVAGIYNISLSHGMPSVIIFLCKLLDLNILSKHEFDISELLQHAVNYILNQKQDHTYYGSYFPSSSQEENGCGKSRLGWCYGDLGIALALKEAAKRLNDKKLYEFSLDIFKFSTNRRDLDNNLIFDAGLCHGSAGLAQFFYSIYKETNIPDFFKAYEYWEQITINFAFKNGDFAKYKSYIPQKKSWEEKNNLLEGAIGVGLSLLSPYIKSWEEILLLTN